MRMFTVRGSCAKARGPAHCLGRATQAVSPRACCRAWDELTNMMVSIGVQVARPNTLVRPRNRSRPPIQQWPSPALADESDGEHHCKWFISCGLATTRRSPVQEAEQKKGSESGQGQREEDWRDGNELHVQSPNWGSAGTPACDGLCHHPLSPATCRSSPQHVRRHQEHSCPESRALEKVLGTADHGRCRCGTGSHRGCGCTCHRGPEGQQECNECASHAAKVLGTMSHRVSRCWKR